MLSRAIAKRRNDKMSAQNEAKCEHMGPIMIGRFIVAWAGTVHFGLETPGVQHE